MNAEFDQFAGNYDAALNEGLKFTGESKTFFAEERMRWLDRRLKAAHFRAGQALDFGCGTGGSLPFFSKYLGVEKLTATDISRDSLIEAQRQNAALKVDYLLNEELSAGQGFDLAFCNGVFHHIPLDQRAGAVRRVFDSLRPGGMFAFWENNPWNPMTRFMMSRVPFDRDAILLWPSGAREMLRQAGFRILRTDFVFIFPSALAALRVMEPFFSGLPLGGQYLVLAQKPETANGAGSLVASTALISNTQSLREAPPAHTDGDAEHLDEDAGPGAAQRPELRMSKKISLSVVLPCLNEEKTLGPCLDKIHASLAGKGVGYEIIVADNGSRDQSATLAKSKGARVVPVAARGYGAAIQGGIAASLGDYFIFADADDTYLLEQTFELYEATRAQDADMGLANRLKGKIEPGAMPLLHRYLGTPVLSRLINLFFSGRVGDCNSGFRCLRKKAYESWNIHAPGMEFASELLIKALKARARIIEIPSGLRVGNPERVAHLRTWRDGMRHLLFILAERPQFSEIGGLTAVFGATILQIIAAFSGPTKVLGLNIFNLHSQAFLFVAALTGLQFYLFACYVYLGIREKPLDLTRRLIHLDEGVLFFVLASCLAAEALVFVTTFVVWARADFSGINLVDRLLPILHLLSLPLMTSIGLAGIHIFKRNSLFQSSPTQPAAAASLSPASSADGSAKPNDKR